MRSFDCFIFENHFLWTKFIQWTPIVWIISALIQSTIYYSLFKYFDDFTKWKRCENEQKKHTRSIIFINFFFYFISIVSIILKKFNVKKDLVYVMMGSNDEQDKTSSWQYKWKTFLGWYANNIYLLLFSLILCHRLMCRIGIGRKFAWMFHNLGLYSWMLARKMIERFLVRFTVNPEQSTMNLNSDFRLKMLKNNTKKRYQNNLNWQVRILKWRKPIAFCMNGLKLN